MGMNNDFFGKCASLEFKGRTIFKSHSEKIHKEKKIYS